MELADAYMEQVECKKKKTYMMTSSSEKCRIDFSKLELDEIRTVDVKRAND